MLTKRIIACLNVRDGRVVKGIQFVDIIDAGPSGRYKTLTPAICRTSYDESTRSSQLAAVNSQLSRNRAPTEEIKMPQEFKKPTFAFVAASWTALFAGGLAFCIALWNASMVLNEKGYYFVLLMYGLFSAVSVQKSVRDRMEGIPVTNIYYGLSWVSVLLAILLLIVGLWNATITLSEKGFYGMSYLLSLFAAIAVQKNTRDSTEPAALASPTSFDRHLE